jgi:hypothetical protein
MNKLADFLAKLDKLTINGVNRDKLTLTTEEGFTIQMKLEVSTVKMSIVYPIQVVIQVIKEGVRVSTWGCESNETNQEAIYWLYARGNKVRDLQYEDEDNKARDLKAEFDKL